MAGVLRTVRGLWGVTMGVHFLEITGDMCLLDLVIKLN